MNSEKNNPVMKSNRMILRPWREEDLEPFALLNADPRVMEYFPATLSREESDQLAKRVIKCYEDNGYCLWAVEIPDIANFIGFIGLAPIPFTAHFTPAIEVGWRLAYDYWGYGFATEGANLALDYGFNVLNQDEIVSITTVENLRSRRVMERIGMHRNLMDDFDHPKLPAGHPLMRHVLYRITNEEWKKRHES